MTQRCIPTQNILNSQLSYPNRYVTIHTHMVFKSVGFCKQTEKAHTNLSAESELWTAKFLIDFI